MVTHYHSSSRGPVEIATMRYEHARNARDKLIREGGDADVIAALDEHVKGIEATLGEQSDG